MAGLIQCARTLGFYVYHTADARRSEPGFPDLVAVHPTTGAVIMFECKAQRGRLRSSSMTKRGRWLPGQADWLSAFQRAGIMAEVVKPNPQGDAMGYDAALALLQHMARRTEAA